MIDFIDYVVSALLTLKASTLLIPWGEKQRKCYGIFANNFHGKPGNVMGFFFSKVSSTLDTKHNCNKEIIIIIIIIIMKGKKDRPPTLYTI